MVTHETGRVLVAVLGVACSVALLLLQFGTVQGVEREANGYVAERPVAAWVGQRSATNLIRSTSFMRASLADALRAVPGVAEVTPLVRLPFNTTLGDRSVTLFVIGIDPASPLTWPSLVTPWPGQSEGALLGDGEVVVDRAFAAKYGVRLGDTVPLYGRDYRVVALSRNTNQLLVQFAFVTFAASQAMLDLDWELASFFLVAATPGVPPEEVVQRVRDEVPRLGVFSQEVFRENSLEELRRGILPLLVTLSFAAGVLALATLSLLLYGHVTDRREEFAVLKALGGGPRYLARVVAVEAVIVAGVGYAAGLGLYLAAVPVLSRVVPEMTQTLTPQTALGVLAAVVVLGLAAAVLPIARLAHVHPAEVFRA